MYVKLINTLEDLDEVTFEYSYVQVFKFLFRKNHVISTMNSMTKLTTSNYYLLETARYVVEVRNFNDNFMFIIANIMTL